MIKWIIIMNDFLFGIIFLLSLYFVPLFSFLIYEYIISYDEYHGNTIGYLIDNSPIEYKFPILNTICFFGGIIYLFFLLIYNLIKLFCYLFRLDLLYSLIKRIKI